MRLVVNSGGPDALPEWREAFALHCPELTVLGWEDEHAHLADYALVWEPTPGRLAAMPHLKLTLSSGAGVDHILADPDYPAHVPIVRMVPPETGQTMAEYVLAAAMATMRDFKALADAQHAHRWAPYPAVRHIADTRIGIMGMGNLGQACARLLRQVGFPVAGWSNRHTDIAGVSSYAGPDELPAFLARCDILVCLLPATDATRGILCARHLSRLPSGAALIAVGRASHMIDEDVQHLLVNKHLSHAVIDVFDTEPLPPHAVWWDHPGVTVTPHCASTPTRAARARHAATLIALHQAQQPLPDLYDPARGY